MKNKGSLQENNHDLSSYRISVHHIGGRGGSGIMVPPNKFKKDFFSVFYEADLECVEQIEKKFPNLNQTAILPYCIGKKCGEDQLNINYDPFTNSLLEANDHYKNFYQTYFDPYRGTIDYSLSDSLQCTEKRTVHTVSLDWLFSKKKRPSAFSKFSFSGYSRN